MRETRQALHANASIDDDGWMPNRPPHGATPKSPADTAANTRTASFRRQHDEIIALIEELRSLFDEKQLARDASPARRLVSAIAGNLTMHLAMEDRSLYPRIVERGNVALRALGNEFVTEMGGLADAWQKFVARWPDARTIQSDAKAFVADAGTTLDAIARRIERENAELYPRVDRMK